MKIIKKSKNPEVVKKYEKYKMSDYNIYYSGQKKTAIFNSASGAVAIIDSDKNIYDRMGYNDSEFKLLVQNGFFVPTSINEYDHYIKKIEFREKKSINFFSIILTTSCNARCFYCYEKDYCKITLDNNTCDGIVDFIAENVDKKDEFFLDWYGGEPLLCVDKIDYIITCLGEKIDMNKKWSSSITTNGVLFDDHLIDYAVNKWKLKEAYITIDGPEIIHNLRKNYLGYVENSPYRITKNAILNLLRYDVFVNLRIHLDNNNKDYFPELIDDIYDLFKFRNLHLFPTFLFPPEKSMPDNYVKDSEKEDMFYDVFKSLLYKRQQERYIIKDFFPEPRNRGCFAERDNTIVIAPDGSKHTCVQGFWSEDFLKEGLQDIFRKACEECKQCKYLPICLGGCLYNRCINGTVRTPCVRNRYVVKPLLRILVETIENGGFA